MVSPPLVIPNIIKGLPFLRRFLFRCSYKLHSVRRKCEFLLSGKMSVAEFLGSHPLVRQSRIMDLAAALHLVSRAMLANDHWDHRWFTLYLEEARGRYRASASVGDLVLLQSYSVATRFVDPKMGWSDLIKGRLVVHRVPGWHADIFQGEGADRTAEHLRSLLDEVDAPVPATHR
jgi:thioesterase domain-containing protein